MNDMLARLQLYLNAHGAEPPLLVDGSAGPKTRSAIIETFRNRNAPEITADEIASIASRLGASPRQIRAFAKVESGRSGWDRAGLLACLWERHYLFRRIRFSVSGLAEPRPGGYTIDADGDGINDSWEKLADAALRWPCLAFECASFGKFQIMGAHWRAIGYASPWDFVWLLSRDEAAHYEAFARYIETNGLAGALAAIDGDPENCRAIARGYNGPRYAKHGYHQRIAAAYKTGLH